AESVALGIIRKHLNPAAKIHEVVFPMVTDQAIDSQKLNFTQKVVKNSPDEVKRYLSK
ncbi:MAG: hypothetical protein GY774_21985, partial [Planctomycetes bacterium]|nr:hypothetical protein [Planctomycetota bacterium]